MKRRIIIIGLLGSLLFASQVLAANFCKDVVIDEAGVLNTGQVDQITKEADKLTRQGVDVRVRTLSDFKGHDSLTTLKASAQGKCGSWKSSDGGMKNNLLLLMVAPKQQATGFFFGDGLRLKLKQGEDQIIYEMNSRFRDGDIAGGLMAGLSNITDLAEVKISQQGKPIVINHAADVSGFASGFKWIIFAIIMGGIILLVIRILRERERRRNAQSGAMTEQGRCTTAINAFETPCAVLKSRIKSSSVSDSKKKSLNERLEGVSAHFQRASARMSGINRGQNDPSTPHLSVEEYERIAFGFKEIADTLEDLLEELNKIERDLNRPETPPFATRTHTDTSKGSKRVHDSSSGEPLSTTRPPAATPSTSKNEIRNPAQPTTSQVPVVEHHHHTTIIDNSTVEYGSLGPRRYESNDDIPRVSPRHESTPSSQPSSQGNGNETSWGRTSSEGGGKESSWGSSSSGSGSASSWRSADFGRGVAAGAIAGAVTAAAYSASAAKDEDSPSDCKASDCAESDCRSSDCAASDCNCDCASSD
jgi:uncharacterized membrane protein YgcG